MFTKTKVFLPHEIQFSAKFLVYCCWVFLRANLCLFPFYSDLDIKIFVAIDNQTYTI